MHWRVKGLLQKALTCTPAGGSVNDWLQLHMGGLRHFESEVDSKVTDDWLVFASHLRALNISPHGLECFEVGTGWFPTLPMCFSLAGARRCRTYDVNAFLSEDLTLRMVQRLECHLTAIAEATRRPLEVVRSDYIALRRCTNLPDVLRQARIEYFPNADAAESGLNDRSIDLVFSNSVMEHVRRDDISRILRENRRILRDAGFAIHSVNCGDHYAYADKNITPINYLTYPENQWTFWNTRFLYQNRLRPCDFEALAEKEGLQIVLLKYTPRRDLVASLPRLKIAAEFQGYSADQLCSTSVDLIARR